MAKGVALTALLLICHWSLAAEPEADSDPVGPPAPVGAVSDKIDRMITAADNPLALVAFDPNYLIFSHTSGINRAPYEAAGESYAEDLAANEVKFQLSFAVPLWRGIAGENSALVGSYTQLSLWQLGNQEISAPFRETNYEPQLFVSWLPDYEFWGWRLALFDLGFNHQSNGRSEPLSRSWNRLYANMVVERGNFAAQFKPWYRLPESSSKDDNPDIEDYLGHSQFRFAYRWDDQVFSARTRFNIATGKGGIEAGWSIPVYDRVRFYLQLYHGYGESLIDYNHEQTRIGLGVMLNDLL